MIHLLGKINTPDVKVDVTFETCIRIISTTIIIIALANFTMVFQEDKWMIVSWMFNAKR